MDSSRPSRLSEVPPEEGGQVLDEEFAASARANLAEFKQVLREEARVEKKGEGRQPDSARRKKLKKERRRERKNTKDDSDRDRNHAIAHSVGSERQGNSGDDAVRDLNHAIAHQATWSVASSLPGLWSLLMASLVGGSQGFASAGQQEDQENEVTIPPDLLWADLIVFCLVITLACLGGLSLFGASWWCWRESGVERNERRRSPGRRVGGTRKRVRFVLPRKGKPLQPLPETPFLGGPKAAKRHHPPDKAIRLATVQGRHEFDQAGFSLLLSRYSQSTAASYQSQWAWWALFCRRRGEDPVRNK